MRIFLYSLVISSLLSICSANQEKGEASSVPTSGALGDIMRSLVITDYEVNNNQVLMVTTKKDQVLLHPQRSKVTTFLLYLSAAKFAKQEGVFVFFDYNRFKLVDEKTRLGSKPFLLEVIKNHPEVRVQNLALLTLGMTFPGSSEVLNLLQDQYFFSRATDARKAVILKTLELGKFQAPIIIRSALYSHNLALVINAASVVKSNPQLYPDLLPDLVAALLTIDTQKDKYQSAYSFLCRTIDLYEKKREYLPYFKRLQKEGGGPHLNHLINKSSKK
jgi:hypothetical protein